MNIIFFLSEKKMYQAALMYQSLKKLFYISCWLQGFLKDIGMHLSVVIKNHGFLEEVFNQNCKYVYLPHISTYDPKRLY